MAGAKNDSLSLLESPVMTQETNEDGSISFKCMMCPSKYKQLKRLQTHLKQKHGIAADLDDTTVSENFSPLMVSTHEDAVIEASNNNDETEEKGETSKETRKRNRETSDEEDDPQAWEKYIKEREKRAKVLEDIENKFESEIGDKTMASAVEEAEATLRQESTQEMTDKLSQAIKNAEDEMIVLEKNKGPDDSLNEDERKIKVSLQHLVDLKDNLLNSKESTIIDLKEEIDSLKKTIEEKDMVIRNKKALMKEKDKEINFLNKKAKTITRAAGNSPSKEALKDKCIKYERRIENLQGRIKNMEDLKDNPSVTKLEQTVKVHLAEIAAIKESLSTFEGRELKLKRKIPCDSKPCPLGRKKCQYSHDLEYKTQTDTYKKQLLCKYFADKGCRLSDAECPFSHSLEMASKRLDEESALSGANRFPIGPRDQSSASSRSYNDTNSFNNIANNRFRKVHHNANNDLSVEIMEDLSGYPQNDARRTLMAKATTVKEERLPRDNFSGNGQGTFGRRPHEEAPQHTKRPQQTHHESRTTDRSRDWQRGRRDWRRADRSRDRYQEGVREKYDRDGPNNQPQRRRY